MNCVNLPTAVCPNEQTHFQYLGVLLAFSFTWDLSVRTQGNEQVSPQKHNRSQDKVKNSKFLLVQKMRIKRQNVER